MRALAAVPHFLGMDLNQIIRTLYAQKEKLERAIAALEDLERGWLPAWGQTRSPRGRKSMSPAERKEVSARMKRYWAKRRGQT